MWFFKGRIVKAPGWRNTLICKQCDALTTGGFERLILFKSKRLHLDGSACVWKRESEWTKLMKQRTQRKTRGNECKKPFFIRMFFVLCLCSTRHFCCFSYDLFFFFKSFFPFSLARSFGCCDTIKITAHKTILKWHQRDTDLFRGEQFEFLR